MAETKTLLKASELALLFEVDLKTVHNWFERGRMPGSLTPGRHLRFDPTEVKEHCEKTGIGVPPGLLAFLTGKAQIEKVATVHLRRASTSALWAELARRGAIGPTQAGSVA